MKKILLMLLACVAMVAPVCGQALLWEVDAAAILAGTSSEDCVVRVDSSGSAWVILQNTTSAKLVRVSAKGAVQSWDLAESDYVYTFRMVQDFSCVVQAGGDVTRVSYNKVQEPGGNVWKWVQRAVVLPDEAGEVSYEELPVVVSTKHFYYVVNNASGVSKIVLRKYP